MSNVIGCCRHSGISALCKNSEDLDNYANHFRRVVVSQPALPIPDLRPGVAFLNFGPVWYQLYPLFVALVVLDFTFTTAMLLRPQWNAGHRIARLIMSGLGIVVLYFLIKAPELFVTVPEAGSQNLTST